MTLTYTQNIIVLNHHEHGGTYHLNDFLLVRDWHIIYAVYLNIPDVSISAPQLILVSGTACPGNCGFNRVEQLLPSNDFVPIELV